MLDQLIALIHSLMALIFDHKKIMKINSDKNECDTFVGIKFYHIIPKYVCD